MKASTLLSISQWLPAHLRSVEDHAEALRIRIFLFLILLCIVPMMFLLLMLLGAMLVGHSDYWQPTLIVIVITTGQTACLLYFLKSGNINLCSLIYAAIIYILVGTATLLTGGWDSPVCSFMLALPVIACLVVSRITGLIFSLAVLLLYSAFFLLSQNGYPTPRLIASEFMPYVSIGMWFTTLSFLVGCLILFDFSTEDLTKIIQQERKQWQKDLDIDELTDTLNPKSFLDAMQQYQADRIASNNNNDFAIIHIQISNLKNINHDFGFEAGDHLLKSTADKIRKAIDIKNAYICRYTPDSFVIVIKSIHDIGTFISCLFGLKKTFQHNIFYDNEVQLASGFQMGAVITADIDSSVTNLILSAKEQMLNNKNQLYTRKENS